MSTFFMFGKYTSDAIKDMSLERTKYVIDEIRKLGGRGQRHACPFGRIRFAILCDPAQYRRGAQGFGGVKSIDGHLIFHLPGGYHRGVRSVDRKRLAPI